MKNKTLVIGASENPSRYSNMAVLNLLNKKQEVVAIGKTGGNIAGVEIHKEQVKDDDIDTVTLYLNPTHQQPYYDYIMSLKPRRIIFNPGAENDELERIATKEGIDVLEACTLVMLNTGQY
ncbi:MAG: CoA-binding protein [Flavipsychrobacter sp.]|nr:CoA-binding protein [Flavipsychrobacter sp.]